ncbi:MAG: phosphinothricin N-acetyltransferase [Caulobacteraceae bacterium]|nr:phosphinothricin N-acetyltransferase [Caulobacteraceae bacterium]
MIIRPAALADLKSCQAIYGHNAVHSTGTFEEAAPSLEEMERRMAAVVAHGLPYLVAESHGRVQGFAYATPFRLRAAYRYTVEDTVYVATDAHDRGVGKALLGGVLKACTQLGVHQVLAVIGDSANARSIGLHRACGFEMIGTAPGLGFKFDRFIDVVFMQKALNGGALKTPKAKGLIL